MVSADFDQSICLLTGPNLGRHFTGMIPVCHLHHMKKAVIYKKERKTLYWPPAKIVQMCLPGGRESNVNGISVAGNEMVKERNGKDDHIKFCEPVLNPKNMSSYNMVGRLISGPFTISILI